MPSEQNTNREKLADEISGIVVGSGYYSMTIGRDAALEAADAILASEWLSGVRREAAAEQREKDAQIAEQFGDPEPSRRFSPEHWDEWRERTSITIAAAIREGNTK